MDFQKISQYTSSFAQEERFGFHKLEAEAEKRHIPIIQKNGIQFIEFLIRSHKPETILEIGTAIGYSATKMAAASPAVKQIVTIERDAQMVEEARHNIQSMGFSERISVLHKDALEVSSEDWENLSGFDMIFIDAAKGQYRHFFKKYSPYLNENGIIITDNVLFRGLTAEWEEQDNKRLANIARKVDEFNIWLHQQKEYDTVFLTIGDGLAISRKL